MRDAWPTKVISGCAAVIEGCKTARCKTAHCGKKGSWCGVIFLVRVMREVCPGEHE